MLLKKLLIVLSVIAMVATLAMVQGCSESNKIAESVVTDIGDNIDATGFSDLDTNIAEEVAFELISEEDALKIAIANGVTETNIYFVDVIPFDLNGNEEFEISWSFVEKTGNLLSVTFINALTGDILAKNISLPENLQEFIGEFPKQSASKALSAINHYESYPWGYDLPTNFGNHILTCGYGGSSTHQGSNYYAIDLALRYGECMPAPGSGWCMFAGDRGDGYGNQVIILGGSAGGSNRYVYRMAHLSSISIRPGWWISKNRSVGGAGSTGNSTGVHVHFSIHRGYYTSGRIVGGSVPLDRWPGPNDRVDYFDRYKTWQFSFNVCR